MQKSIRDNYVQFSNDQLKELEISIEKNYLNKGLSNKNLTTGAYEAALETQIYSRLEYNRTRIIPWLNKIKPLDGSTVLEIGCGTGIGTLAMAEQGASVTGLDVDEGALKVAHDRLRIANIEASVQRLTHTENEINELEVIFLEKLRMLQSVRDQKDRQALQRDNPIVVKQTKKYNMKKTYKNSQMTLHLHNLSDLKTGLL